VLSYSLTFGDEQHGAGGAELPADYGCGDDTAAPMLTQEAAPRKSRIFPNLSGSRLTCKRSL
jgi:hypothetical protein